LSLQGPTTTHPTPQAHKRTTQRHREPSRTLRPNMAQSSGSQTVKVAILSRCVVLSCKLPAHLLFIAPGACWPAEQDALSVVGAARSLRLCTSSLAWAPPCFMESPDTEKLQHLAHCATCAGVSRGSVCSATRGRPPLVATPSARQVDSTPTRHFDQTRL
jgi:hypothetical protein